MNEPNEKILFSFKTYLSDITSSSKTTTSEATPTQELTLFPSTSKGIPIFSTLITRVTAPETTCDGEDLDCIIEDLGKKPEWFICKKEMENYPHPASKKLFIFCLNWKPLVKKCGQGRVFSEKFMTCINP